MARCVRTQNLEVHHKRIDGGNDLGNAQVLCKDCHVNTSTYGSTGHKSPPPFDVGTKESALKRAGNRCECDKGDCCGK